MFGHLFSGFHHLYSSGVVLFLLAGVFFGIIVGALPGLTATMGIALLIPFTYNLDSSAALSLLIGIFAGGIYGGSISAILLKTPGTPAAGATVLDGYPLAQQGQAGKALTVATVASAMGGLIGALILTFLAPQIARIAVMFGPAEYVMLGIYGLTMIAYVSQKSMLKGVFMGLLGLLISTVGVDPISGYPRFTFGTLNLLSGVNILPILIGLFAMTQALNEIEDYDVPMPAQAKITSIGISWTDFKLILPHIFKSACIGTGIGAVPGTGTDIAAFLSYGEAKRSSKNRAHFGKGAIEGIAAPEAGNNGCVCGALIPMFTLGIPGEAATAVILGGFIALGLQPGPLLFKEDPQIIFTVFASTISSNFFILALGIVGARFFARVLSAPRNMIVACIFLLAIIGSYSMRNNMFDVMITVLTGLFGYIAAKADYPAPPLLLGLILGGNIVESNLGRMLIIYDSIAVIFERPICWIFMALIGYTLVSSILNKGKTPGDWESAAAPK